MSKRNFVFLITLWLNLPAHAEVYKWTEPSGNVSYGDRPPAASVTTVQERFVAGVDRETTFPYELAQAVKNMPVTLYSAENCPACNEGRQFLKQSGIPFSEKTISSQQDIDKLVQISGGAHIPVLFIGSQKFLGFNSGDWRTSLTQAGYPQTNRLPANYQFMPPQPLVPVAHSEGMEAKNDVKGTLAPQRSSSTPSRDPNAFHF